MRAGFIEAPVSGPANSAHKATVPPIAGPAVGPSARLSVATAVITNMSRKVMINSINNAATVETLGVVEPSEATGPTIALNAAAAATAASS